MGLTNCKSLFTSKSKTEHSVINGNVTNHPQVQPFTGNASELNISTIQNEMASQENIASIERATPSMEVSRASIEIAVATIEESVIEIEEDFIEHVACNDADLGENEMREIDMGDDKKVLLIKQHGKIFAIGSKCSHYGAPLVNGALGEGRIRCPWHGACFDIETGDIEDYPGLDSLPCFKVTVEEGAVKVRARKSDLQTDRRMNKTVMKDSRNGEIYVIIGGGPCAQTCAETLRQNSFKGRILMICKESYLPYDRVKVSKYLNIKLEEIQLRTQSFYDENQIEVSLNVEAISLDTNLKEISLSSGNKLKYDKLFIATGSRPRKPNILGNHLKNIFTLRGLDDARSIDSSLKPSSHVVILGSSFIGLEAAAYCAAKVAKVTIVGRSSVPLKDSFGEAIGKRIMQLFESNNVEFIMESGVKSFLSINQEEYISAVKLLSNDTLKADVCIIGIGSELNTDFLLDSGLSINTDGSINTDIHLKTNIDDIYVGGDIANSPIYTNGNECSTIGHYASAQYQGRVAALNMIGSETELRTVPYFFTFLFDNCFTYTGHGKASEIFIEGDLEALKFVAFYFDENENVIAMSSCQPNKRTAEFAERLAQGHRFVKKDLWNLLKIKIETPKSLRASSAMSSDEVIEKIACNESDLAENEMREIDMGDDKKVLLIKQNGKISAIGSKCAHYGAPLVNGALGEGRIRCPWHGACFNITTGDIEDYPGLDSLPCFNVAVDEGVVKIRAKRSELENDRRIKPATMKVSENVEIYVIIGGGPSAQTCAETLRQNGFSGKILMICKEPSLPYDRVKVSKYLNIKLEEIQLRTQSFYEDYQIEVSLNVEATSLDTNLKEVSLSSGIKLKYDKIFIATGSRARKPEIAGSGLKNIFTLRSLHDAHSIDAVLKPTSHVVVMGSNFIGMEVAAYLVDKVAKVTVVGRTAAPLMEVFGEAIGNRIMQLFKSKNVSFVMETRIKSFLGNDEYLEGVELLTGGKLLADVCVVGIGSELNTDFLLNSGLSINKDGSIDTNIYLETNVADIFVGGDIANSPVFSSEYQLATIGHYALAQYHGKVAALNMIGSETELKAVPYFFTYLFGHCFTYTGHGKATEIFIEGDLEALKFVAFYFDAEESIIAMSSCQFDRSIADFAEKLAQGYHFSKDDIEWVNENEL